MTFTIKSRRLNRELTFSRPGNLYIFVDVNGQPGMLGEQICYGGGFLGDTISYRGDDENEFKRICRLWYRAYLQNYDKE